MDVDEPAAAAFEAQRPRLFGLAYRLLGSAADAEDIVQETFLRWYAADRSVIVEPAAWLAKVTTNLAVNRLGSARVRRESYVGPWLPEPVLTGDGVTDPLETAERRESVSMGVLLLLERLSPQERAVFVLREAFGHSHREIATVLDIEEAHSRQLHRRGREHVGDADRRSTVDDTQRRRIVESFLTAVLKGDVASLERLLADDVVSRADGGGATPAARRPVTGRDRVARYLVGLLNRPEAAAMRTRTADVGGEPAMLIWLDGHLLAVFVPQVDGERVTALHLVLNPAKLEFAAAQLT